MSSLAALKNPVDLLARLLISTIFLMSGWGKLMAYTGTAGYMEAQGVPGMLLPLVILTELGGGLLIVLGWQTRVVAFLLAGFTLLAGALFHYDPTDQGQMIHFMKNLGVTGGFLFLLVNGAGGWSLDARGKNAARMTRAQ